MKNKYLGPMSLALLLLTALAPRTGYAGGSGGLCEQPNVLVVLDYSGSMNELNKWGQAVGAVEQLAIVFERTMRLGLMLFPWNSDCGVNFDQAVRTPCLPDNADNIRNQLRGAGRPPRGNNTPIGRALDQASQYFVNLGDMGRRSFIVLVTDGIETCRGQPVRSAENAFRNDQKVFVIGFGNGVDRNTLNRIAQAGGTGVARNVNDQQQLLDALEAIANEARQEICDALDNDCDGSVDEGIGEQACETECGTGTQQCVDGQFSLCAGGDIPMEECNGIDDDCDGETDEFVMLPCVTVSGNAGFNECINGAPDEECTPEDPDREEVCDGIDNDMDGRIDENMDLECEIECHRGRRICLNGAYLSCTAAPVTEEICNGLDDDCDGETDEMTECVGAEVCGDEGICLRPCTAGECPEGFFCDQDRYCHPRPCVPECEADQICRGQECFYECVLSRDCPAGYECQNGLCFEGTATIEPAPMGDGGLSTDFSLPPVNDSGMPRFISPDAGNAGDGAADAGCQCDQRRSAWPSPSTLFWTVVLGVGLVRRRRKLDNKVG